MDLMNLLEAVNAPEILEQLTDQARKVLSVDGWNMTGNNPLIPTKPISDIPR